jgi:hypothetical protein
MKPQPDKPRTARLKRRPADGTAKRAAPIDSASAKPVAKVAHPKPKSSANAISEGGRTKANRRARSIDPHEKTQIGFRKPPKAHSWKKGQSGNPTGRKKGNRNKKTIIISLMEGRLGRKIPDPRKLSAQEAMLWKAIQKGLAGDAKAMAFAFKRYDDATSKSWAGPVDTTEEDQLVYDALRAKIRQEIEEE